MPHPKAFRLAAAPSPNESSRAGAIVIAAISASLLAGATLFARNGSFASPIAVVSDTRTLVVPASGRATVTGRVLDADGRAVAGSAVRVRSSARPNWDWVTSSALDGSFQVDGVVSGKVCVSAQDIDAGLVESPPLEANDARDVVLVLDRTLTINGAVLDMRGAPIARAAIKWSSTSGAADRVVIADDDGRFELRGAARSVDHLTVWARGFEPSTVLLRSVGPGTLQRDVRLRGARPLHGIVVDPSGDRVAGARVSACPGKEAEVALSDGAGAFELPATATGCWATAMHPRFSSARAVRIGDRGQLVLRLGTGGAIEGTVVDQRGKSIGLFSVTIGSFEAAEEAPPGAATRSGEASEHLRGTFRLDDLPPGTYQLQVSAEGMVDAQSRPIEVGRGKVVRGEQIVLTPAVGEGVAAVEEEAAAIDSTDAAERADQGDGTESDEGTGDAPR